MEYLLAGVVVLFVVTVLAQDWARRKEMADQFSEFRAEREALMAEHRDERRELLNRIQHPERPQNKPGQGHTRKSISDETRRELHSVGTVAPQVANGES